MLLVKYDLTRGTNMLRQWLHTKKAIFYFSDKGGNILAYDMVKLP